MSLTLYHSQNSSASRRVRLFIEEKGLSYNSHVLDLGRQEQHQPAYLAINPMGVVPTMLHEGRPLHESSVICEYLEAQFPDTPLLPRDPYDLALCRNWVRHVDSLIGNLIRFNWRHSVAKLAQKMSDAELEEMLKKVPTAERKEAWMRAARRPYTEAELEESRAILLAMLDRMEGMMTNGALIGGAYSLADIAVVPFVKRISEEIAPNALSPDVRPNVAAWWDVIQARPAYQRAGFTPFPRGV